MSHTPEPWEVSKNGPGMIEEEVISILSPEGEEIAYIPLWPENPEERARRIVACVNACQNISDEDLADDCISKMRADRDQLLDEQETLVAQVTHYEAKAEGLLRERDEARAMVAELRTMAEDLLEDCFNEHGGNVQQDYSCPTCERYNRYRIRLESIAQA